MTKHHFTILANNVYLCSFYKWARASGIPVVGIFSRSYFGSKRSARFHYPPFRVMVRSEDLPLVLIYAGDALVETSSPRGKLQVDETYFNNHNICGINKSVGKTASRQTGYSK